MDCETAKSNEWTKTVQVSLIRDKNHRTAVSFTVLFLFLATYSLLAPRRQEHLHLWVLPPRASHPGGAAEQHTPRLPVRPQRHEQGRERGVVFVRNLHGERELLLRHGPVWPELDHESASAQLLQHLQDGLLALLGSKWYFSCHVPLVRSLLSLYIRFSLCVYSRPRLAQNHGARVPGEGQSHP